MAKQVAKETIATGCEAVAVGSEAVAAGNGKSAADQGITHECNNQVKSLTHAQTTAVWVAAFFDELVRWGVHEVVISPGSRSTPLAMAAFELSERQPSDLRIFIDIDERGAAFFALGMAKASGRPVALVCTSGSAVANYYPAVIEARTSRVPLIVLSGDRPPRLQDLGAPQTTDQLKIYGDAVRSFRAMPLPGNEVHDIAFVRQAAREACLAAMGCKASVPYVAPAQSAAEAANTSDSSASNTCAPSTQIASRACDAMAGPVHLNFPFEEPLKPDFTYTTCFSAGRRPFNQYGIVGGAAQLSSADALRIAMLIAGAQVVVLAGEGTCSTLAEARDIVHWAERYQLPLIADPLSGLRSIDHPLVIDNYDSFIGSGLQSDLKCGLHSDSRHGLQSDSQDNPQIAPTLVIRFGRYPVSKSATVMLGGALQRGEAMSIVVDAGQTRDIQSATDLFVATTPREFAQALLRVNLPLIPGLQQRAYSKRWVQANDAARVEIEHSESLEIAHIRAIVDAIPAASCVFAASSMAIRNLDTAYLKRDKPLCVLCNRGQNGIDGTTSTALGAATHFKHTTYIAGDLTLLHDLNALALQRELMRPLAHRQQALNDARQNSSQSGENALPSAQPQPVETTLSSLPSQSAATAQQPQPGTTTLPPSIVIVLFNNNGGNIFKRLPQASDEPYFERLFLTPQDVNFEAAAAAFGVPYKAASSLEEFNNIYKMWVSHPGIHLIEVHTSSQ